MAEVDSEEELVKIKGFKTVNYICDSCKTGKMLPTGIALTSMPPLFQHKCDNCGEINSFIHTYPRTVIVIG